MIGTLLYASWLFLLCAPLLYHRLSDLTQAYLWLLQSPWILVWALADVSHIIRDILIAITLKRESFVPSAPIPPRGLLMEIFGTKSKRWFAI